MVDGAAGSVRGSGFTTGALVARGKMAIVGLRAGLPCLEALDGWGGLNFGEWKRLDLDCVDSGGLGLGRVLLNIRVHSAEFQ